MNANRGKQLVILIIVFVMAFTLIMTAMQPRPLTDSIRLILTIALLFFLYRGAPWARWVLVVLFVLGGGIGLFAAVMWWDPNNRSIWISLATTIVYFSSAVLLSFSPSVKSFLQSQRESA